MRMTGGYTQHEVSKWEADTLDSDKYGSGYCLSLFESDVKTRAAEPSLTQCCKIL